MKIEEIMTHSSDRRIGDIIRLKIGGEMKLTKEEEIKIVGKWLGKIKKFCRKYFNKIRMCEGCPFNYNICSCTEDFNISDIKRALRKINEINL